MAIVQQMSDREGGIVQQTSDREGGTVQQTSDREGWWRWMVVVAVFVIFVIMDGVRYSFGQIYLELLEHFQAGHGVTGAIGGIMFGLLLTAAPIAGALINRFGCRIVTVVGTSLVFIGFLTSAFATSIGYLFLSLGILGGLGFSMMFMSGWVVIIQYFDKLRSLALGLAVSGSGIGGFVFNPFTNWLLAEYTWRGTLLILSSVLLHGVACGMIMRPVNVTTRPSENQPKLLDQTNDFDTTRPRENKQKLIVDQTNNFDSVRKNVNENDKDAEETTRLNEAQLLDTEIGVKLNEGNVQKRQICSLSLILDIFAFRLLKNKIFLLFIIMEVFINISYMVPFIYIPDMARERIPDVTRTDIVWLLNAMSIANVASRVPVGLLVDMKCIRGLLLMALLCIAAGLSCGIMPFCRGYGAIMTACVCFSTCIVSAMILTPVALTELFGEELVTNSLGLSLFFGGVAGFLGPPMAGWLFDLSRNYESSFLVAGVEFMLAGFTLLLISYVRKRHNCA